MKVYLNDELTDIYELHSDWNYLYRLVHSEFGKASRAIEEKSKEMGIDFKFATKPPKLTIDETVQCLEWRFSSFSEKKPVMGCCENPNMHYTTSGYKCIHCGGFKFLYKNLMP
jgi:hypothetical protein